MAVRKIKKSYRSVTGYFMSRKNNQQLAFESTLERDLFMILEFDSSVISFEEQPFKLRYICDGAQRPYTPDCLVNYKESSSIYEVKYQNEINSDPDLQNKLACIKKHFTKEGKYPFKIFTDTDINPVYLQNLKFLYKFAFLKPNLELTQLISNGIHTISSPISIKDFLYTVIIDKAQHLKALPYLWHFITIHPHILDLDEKLNMNTFIKKDPICLN